MAKKQTSTSVESNRLRKDQELESRNLLLTPQLLHKEMRARGRGGSGDREEDGALGKMGEPGKREER